MQTKIDQIVDTIDNVLYGKKVQIRQALTCILSGGHLLIEDLPGMGKTTLSHAFAKVLGLDYQRVQFTSDMLPADILGVSIYDQQNADFKFKQGPVFTQLLLADEINRTTPKTQSALLEAMEEHQVTVDGQTHSLPRPFFVIATQNPLTQYGTYPLPESQLDRFLMRVQLGYPSREAERILLEGGDSRQKVDNLPCLVTEDELFELQRACQQTEVSDAVLDYLQRLVIYTRESSDFVFGISPRGSLALLKTARTWAYIHGRAYVVPEDIQTLIGPVFGHRLRSAEDYAEHASMALIKQLLADVNVLG